MQFIDIKKIIQLFEHFPLFLVVDQNGTLCCRPMKSRDNVPKTILGVGWGGVG